MAVYVKLNSTRQVDIDTVFLLLVLLLLLFFVLVEHVEEIVIQSLK